VFARSLRVAIAGVRSVTVARRGPKAAHQENMSTSHKSDQAARGKPDPRQLADQQAKRDVNKLLDRYGVVS